MRLILEIWRYIWKKKKNVNRYSVVLWGWAMGLVCVCYKPGPVFCLLLGETWARFLPLAWSKLRLCSANHRPGNWSNLPCDWPSSAWVYSKQEKMCPCLFSTSVTAVLYPILFCVIDHIADCMTVFQLILCQFCLLTMAKRGLLALVSNHGGRSQGIMSCCHRECSS